MADNGLTDKQMAEILWPDAGKDTRRVLMARWLTKPVISIRLDQLQRVHDLYPDAEIIGYEE